MLIATGRQYKKISNGSFGFIQAFAKMKSGFAILALSGLLALAAGFDVPEPVFKASLYGLQATVPDAEGIHSVRISLAAQLRSGDGNEEDVLNISEEMEKNEDGQWIFYNPEVIMDLDDLISYKIFVKYDDSIFVKEGEHKIEEVYPSETQPFWKIFGPEMSQSSDVVKQRSKRLITEGKKSSYHSSYSTYQSSDAKPITRSSKSSTTGTYVLKPNGEVEASGYKTSESYDSTKREGEQWETSEREMTTEELEELKRFIGPGFRSFSELTDGQVEEFKRLHGSNFHIPERLRGPERIGAARSYEESYFGKESSSSSRNQEHIQQPSSSNYEQYHQSHFTRESSTNRHKPSSTYPETGKFRVGAYPGSFSHVSPPYAPETFEDDHQESVPVALPSQSGKTYEFSRGESHRVVSSQASPRPVTHSDKVTNDYEYSASGSHRTISGQTSLRPVTHSDKVTSDYDYSSAGSRRTVSGQTSVRPVPLSNQSDKQSRYDSLTKQEQYEEDYQVEEKPKYQVENRYSGSVFTTVTSSRVNTPFACSAWAESNYDSVTDLREIQKTISQMKCLANLAESSLREEIRVLKQQNSDLSRKMEILESDLRSYRASCRCSG